MMALFGEPTHVENNRDARFAAHKEHSRDLVIRDGVSELRGCQMRIEGRACEFCTPPKVRLLKHSCWSERAVKKVMKKTKKYRRHVTIKRKKPKGVKVVEYKEKKTRVASQATHKWITRMDEIRQGVDDLNLDA